ncbi:CBS domain-containing protein [Streptomyces sp. NPDC048568]|uniref:CBS domain-containing protein n=1 Tax=Streptomyces sp. NPDC048568 TaxID=3365571 RepID=UPI00371D6F9C
MQHRTVGDLMTRGVVQVHKDASFKTIARLLADNDVTALPVVDDLRHPLGVVSEADLVVRIAERPDPAGPVVYAASPRTDDTAGDDVTAEALMTAPAECARPEWTVVEAARAMESGGVKRLPVVDEAGQLVGIVSRGDLLRVFLRRDEALREEISRDLLVRTLGLAPTSLTVNVTDGRVTLKGRVDSAELVPVIERLCLGVDGVVSVDTEIVSRSGESVEDSIS